MIRKFGVYFLVPLLLATACAGTSNINIRKNPTVDFSLEGKSPTVAILPSRNFSEHHEIDLSYLDGKLLTGLRSQFPKVRFIAIRKLKDNILNEQDAEVVDKFINEFAKSGTVRAEKIKNTNEIIKVGYYLAPSFGANIGAGYSAEWIFTLSLQIYEGKSGKTVFSVTAEKTEESVEGFDLQKSALFESVIDNVIDTIP